MADDSQKEKETANEQEKEEDTAAAGDSPKAKTPKPDSKPGSRAGSKPGSAKSARTKTPGSPKSTRAKSPKSARSNKSGKQSGKKSKSAKSEAESTEPSGLPDDLQGKIDHFQLPDELPPGAKSLFIASKTQEIVALTGATAEKPVVMVPKAVILADMRNRAAVSDFSPLKAQINEYPEELIMIVADVDYKFGENFIIAITSEAKEALLPWEPGVSNATNIHRHFDLEPF